MKSAKLPLTPSQPSLPTHLRIAEEDFAEAEAVEEVTVEVVVEEVEEVITSNQRQHHRGHRRPAQPL